jgi:cation diffusion facilitator family transporter
MTPRSPQKPDTARSIFYALGANVAIAVAKFAGAAYTGSGALLAEGLHSLADTGNEALLLLGRKQAKARPSARHPLGQGRAKYFWSFVVAVLLFSIGGLLSIYEGVRKLDDVAPIEMPWVAVTIVLFAMAAEGFSLRTALQQVGKVRGDRSLWRWFRETRHSELIVVLSEDLAAIAGLFVALAALLATIATGNSVYDAAGSVAIGVVLIVVASGLANEVKSMLIGESASPRTRRAIRAFLQAQPGVLEICDLVTMQLGDDLIIAIRAYMRTSTGHDLVHAIADCKMAIAAEFPQATWIFFEPADAVHDPGKREPARLERAPLGSRSQAHR